MIPKSGHRFSEKIMLQQKEMNMPGPSLSLVLLAATMLGGTFAAPALAQEQSATWSMAAPLPQGRSETQAATVGDKIYLIGGGWTQTKDGKSTERYTDGFAT